MRVLLLGLLVVLLIFGAVALAAGRHATSEPTQTAQRPVEPTTTPASNRVDVANPIPQDGAAAAALFGGAATDWQVFDGNGWIFRSAVGVALTVPLRWRIDYTAPSGAVFSCGDVQEPGQYGPLTVVTSAATLWYVPGEAACPGWTIWSQAHKG